MGVSLCGPALDPIGFPLDGCGWMRMSGGKSEKRSAIRPAILAHNDTTPGPCCPHGGASGTGAGSSGLIGSVRDLGSIFQKAGEFDASRVFAPFQLDAPAALRCWPVPPLKAKYTEAALVQ